MNNTTMQATEQWINRIIQGDCIEILKQMPSQSVDLVVTDPPYLVNYKSRDGRSILNDRYSDWIKPAFSQIYRVLKPDSFCISFYGWNHVEKFMIAWKQAGFYPIGHLVWKKNYPSSKRFLMRCHENAYLLSKGYPSLPERDLPDVLSWQYSGNRLHPNQKPFTAIQPLIRTFSKPNDVILDPFCGSGTTAVAAKTLNRHYIGIEKDKNYWRIAAGRLKKLSVSV